MAKLNDTNLNRVRSAAYLRKLADQIESDEHFIIDLNLSQTTEHNRGSAFDPNVTRMSVDFSVTVIDGESTPSLTGIYYEVSK